MGQIITRGYIVFRGSNISCSLACRQSLPRETIHNFVLKSFLLKHGVVGAPVYRKKRDFSVVFLFLHPLLAAEKILPVLRRRCGGNFQEICW